MKHLKYWLFMVLAVPAVAIAFLSTAVLWLVIRLRDLERHLVGKRNGADGS